MLTVPAHVVRISSDPLSFDIDGKTVEFPGYSLHGEAGGVAVLRDGSIVKSYETFPSDRDVYNFVAAHQTRTMKRGA